MAKTPRKSSDLNVTAFRTLEAIAGTQSDVPVERQKNPAAVALGRLGGLKGGKARAAALNKSQRSKIAKKAAESRWANQNRK